MEMKLLNGSIDLKCLSFYFKEIASFVVTGVCQQNPKNPHIWKPVRQCETEERSVKSSFKQAKLDVCDRRRDDWSTIMEIRVNGAQTDLPAADAQYHAKSNRCITWTVGP